MPTLNKGLLCLQKHMKTLGNTLHYYQLEGIKTMMNHEKHNYGGILADEMGLGKTLQMIGLICAHKVKYTLVIVPANLILQWKSEITKFAPDINIIMHWRKHKFDPSTLTNHNIILTTYYYIKEQLFREIKFDRIVCDEAHYFRNKKSKTYKNMSILKSDKKWCITGTPIQNYLKDIKTIINFILPDVKLNLQNIEENIKKLIIRRTKEEVNIKLPKIKHKLKFINFSSIDETKMYSKLEKLQEEFSNIKQLEKQLRLRQVCAVPKSTSIKFKLKYKTKNDVSKIKNTKLDYIIKQVIKNKHQLPIIFTQFHNEIEYLENKLKSKIKIATISGKINQEQRNIILNDNTIDALIVQIVAGGTGLNLQRDNTVYFTTPNWNPSLEEQAICRAHRIGQKNNVTINKIIMGNIKTYTIEKRILAIQKEKKKLINKFIKA